jgi:hypothetical protein
MVHYFCPAAVICGTSMPHFRSANEAGGHMAAACKSAVQPVSNDLGI